MERISFAILGGGWRSEFYARVANAAPDRFALRGVWIRNPEKAARYAERLHAPVFSSFDELLSLDVDFFVLCLPWQVNDEYSRRLAELGRPVLTETPPAPTVEALNELWRFAEERGANIQVAEEYHLQPYHASVIRLAEEGRIGVPTHLSISMMHGYHCMSLARRMLGVGMERAVVSGKQYPRAIAQTCSRAGESAEHPIQRVTQDRVTFEFESGKTLFYDFTGEQYFSLLRSTHLWLCGDRGEVMDRTVRFLSPSGACMAEELRRVDLGQYGNLQGFAHRGIQFCGEWLYENPLPLVRLTDDEIAVASLLLKMKRCVETGEPVYSLREACQDTYLAFAMREALETGRPVETKPQSWNS